MIELLRTENVRLANENRRLRRENVRLLGENMSLQERLGEIEASNSNLFDECSKLVRAMNSRYMALPQTIKEKISR